ncbi:hypothetical protein OHD60_08325 [Escherichia coli]|nr:hypothetical protein [Escherichia coli]
MLYRKPGIPLAVIEAKANKHEIGKGMQQGIEYARLLDVLLFCHQRGWLYLPRCHRSRR